MEEKIAITDYIGRKEYFLLPLESWPKLRLEIFNEKKKEWRLQEFDIFIRPHGKKKKTDKHLKIYYQTPNEK